MRGARGRASLWAVALLASEPSCQRGCASTSARDLAVRAAGVSTWPGSSPLAAIDCPDGLARCSDGNIEVSRLARVAGACRGPESACGCPWEPLGRCQDACVANGLEVVMGRGHAGVQLCAARVGTVLAGPPAMDVVDVPGCDDGQLYRCVAGDVVDCPRHAVVGSCLRGCVPGTDGIDGASGEPGPDREGAFAILCSR